MKVAPILAELREKGHESVLVHTGQHYDDAMSDVFFRDLGLPAPDHHLGVGSGSHAHQTARVMEAFEPVLLAERPDWVVVVGDINSTLACALVTVKLKTTTNARLAHVEAGLRSHDWRMPEEINRVVTDRVSDLLLLPSRDAEANLLAEGIPADRIRFAGNVMIDTLLRQRPRARELETYRRFGLNAGNYALVTLHRPSNVDDPAALSVILEALNAISTGMPVLFPMHPRTRSMVGRFGLEELLTPLHITEPVGYSEMLSLVDAAAIVLTDSGGLQEETTVLGVPCLTLREQTERPITVTAGTNRLAPWPLTVSGVVAAAEASLSAGRPDNPPAIDGWDGRAAERIVAALASE
jgi:UDP-N-acetylglucosamine 2-epimerase (non-hydrolysing)